METVEEFSKHLLRGLRRDREARHKKMIYPEPFELGQLAGLTALLIRGLPAERHYANRKICELVELGKHEQEPLI